MCHTTSIPAGFILVLVPLWESRWCQWGGGALKVTEVDNY